ncbi:MAG: HAD-IC family P-type ATPase, partial [Synergistes sp.]|nr:HAD-IC family P-type ATPase [Synergistes sp.]
CGEEHGHAHDHGHSHEHEHDHDDCGCGENHGHSHEHDDCGCGRDHGHSHSHPEDCQCEICHPHEDYCDVCGESLANCTCRMPDAANKKRVYILENLGCANCAAKMEAKIRALPEVDYATVTFSTKQLRVSAKDPDALLPVIQDICSSIESEVVVKKRQKKAEQASPVAAVSGQGEKKSFISKETTELLTIIIGAALFIVCEIIHETSHDGGFPKYMVALCAVTYLILSWKILLTAIRNIPKGRFDENFLMTVATVGAFITENYLEAVGVIMFYRIGQYFEHRAVEKSRKAIMETVDMRPDVVNLLVGEEVKVIPAESAVVGDIILVRPGDRIPLDGVVIDGESRIDTSPVTGEPVPVKAGYGDEVVSGCVNTSGMLKIRVEKPLDESMVTKILDAVENAAASKPRMERFITRFARIYTPIVVAIAVCTAIIPSLFTGNWHYWIYTALTFLVISCPCA